MERLDLFMARANAQYYATHDPFADFTTAPEISQAFGEVLGAWAAVQWESMGCPDPVILAEAGPGRGTLMADAVRAVTRVAPAFRAALRLHLVETSPRLRTVQAALLPGATWHDRVEDLPGGPIILLANEFLDALPIRQFVQRGDTWSERFVDDGKWFEIASLPLPLRERAGVRGVHPFGIADASGPYPSPLPQAGEGEEEVWEWRDPALAHHLGDRLRAAPGTALFLDYGPLDSSAGDSLQALRAGQPADPLADPGAADLTAHVDFTAFARASGLPAYGPLPQGKFLTRLGLFARIHRLATTLPPREAMRMTEAGRRLAEPDRMGALFKALALTSPGLPIPAGFEP
jgi:NADH dehydrogenase [ubiquinone] 1 alpha subcomplex assembly factor 7